MKRIDYTTNKWDHYELLDSGEGRKLELFDDHCIDRPDPQALWKKTNPSLWHRATARFVRKEKTEQWSLEKGTSPSWTMESTGVTLMLSFGKFKHIGVFPEHECQWRELSVLCAKNPGIRVLNLFGYTGAASLVCAAHGASVTHIDASKQTIGVVKENMKLSQIRSDAIRIVCEDALKYAKRLVQRKEVFDVVIMDPPAFGRGPKGEVWKIEEKLLELVALVPTLLSQNARLVLMNGYAAGYSARSFGELLGDALLGKGGSLTYGDVGIEQNGGRVLSTGIYAKWEK